MVPLSEDPWIFYQKMCMICESFHRISMDFSYKILESSHRKFVDILLEDLRTSHSRSLELLIEDLWIFSDRRPSLGSSADILLKD